MKDVLSQWVLPAGRPLLIGWKEYLDFTDWHIPRVKAKVDTGARTSAISAISYELRESPDHGLLAELRLALYHQKPEVVTVILAPVLETIIVSNSNGMREQRPVVETTVRLGPIEKRVRFTVTNRFGMLFPMILGRKALEGDFLVDVGRKYALRRKRSEHPPRK